MSITQPIKKSDKVAYYVKRRTSATKSKDHDISGGYRPVRRTGTVQGWRDGKVIVLHPAKYTELLAEADLYPFD